MSQRRIILWLVLLVLAGLALRIGVIVKMRSWRNPAATAMEHRAVALSVVRGQGFSFGDFGYFGPSSVQSPPYPFLLIGLFKVFGEDAPAAYVCALVLNAAVGAMTIWLTYLLARTIGASAGVGVLAAATCAFWPTQVYTPSHIQAITFIIAGVVGIMILFDRAVRGGKVAPWIGFSVVGTLAALVEPVLLPIMAFSGILILVWRPGVREIRNGRRRVAGERVPPVPSPAEGMADSAGEGTGGTAGTSPGCRLKLPVRVRNAAVLLAAAMVIIGPWSLRNRLVHGQWIPIKSTFWVNVWKANNDFATGTDRLALSPEQRRALWGSFFSPNSQAVDPEFDKLRQYDKLTAEQRQRLEKQPEAVRENVFKEFATGWIKAHPGGYLRLCLVRLGKSLWVDLDNPKSFNFIVVGSRTALLAMSAVGLVLALRGRWAMTFPLLVAGSCYLLYTLTITAARFSLPFEPLQFILAAQVIVSAAAVLCGKARTTSSRVAAESL